MTHDVRLTLDMRANPLCMRTINALTHAGIGTWDALVAEATRTPNALKKLPGLGPKGLGEIVIALNAERITHTLTSRRTRRPKS